MTEKPHWTTDRKWIAWFYSGALNVARDAGLIDPEGVMENPVENDAMLELVSSFMDEVKPLDWFAKQGDAAKAFKAWIGVPKVKPLPDTSQRISATVRKSYGGVVVEFSYSAVFDARTPAAAAGAYNFCLSQIEQQFTRYELIGLKNATVPVVNDSTGPQTVSFIGTTILVETKDNKRYYKVKGGQYEKWGVRVWPEVLEAANVAYDALPLGETSFARPCMAEIVDGKVKRVISVGAES